MRNRIMAAAMKEINETGIKFTMLDLATRLGISKTTLYAHFKSKEYLIGAIMDSLLESVQQQDEEILNNDMMNIPEKLKALFVNEPKILLPISNNFILALKRQFPEEWKKSHQYRDQKWQLIESLLIQGMESGYFRPIDLTITKVIFTATVNELLDQNFLMQNSLTFKKAMEKVANILYFGIILSDGSSQNVSDK
ncbi:MAG: TetR/AcrR family transcriptional regulator [Pelosinus sp.]|nr:TetR/AcrR family transcriptional regulator [Pelosinus sp.]